jgi:PhoPQ-activated pathogenicity-related protein
VRKNEDEFVAATWVMFLQSGAPGKRDATWIDLMPMTKSIVKAMDAVTEWAATTSVLETVVRKNAAKKNVNKNAKENAKTEYVAVPPLTKFIVAGASKRGWATWMTAAVDARIVAAVPIVMDMLNFYTSISHMCKLNECLFACSLTDALFTRYHCFLSARSRR